MAVEIIVAIIAGSATIASAGIAAWATREKRRAEKRVKALESAPYRFADYLGNAIGRTPPPIESADDERDLIVNAQAIVRLRDSLREPLSGLDAALNGQIDTLSEIVGEIGRSDQRYIDSTRLRAAAEAIQVLRIVWPAKRDEITVRIRQLLVTLEDLGTKAAPISEPPRRNRPPEDRPRPQPA